MARTLAITPDLAIPEDALAISYIRSSGPGGQNVNKVATAAQLRFGLADADLPPDLKHRAARLAGSRLTGDGEIVITASTYRTQAQNRMAAIERLLALLRAAAERPKKRIATRPTQGSKRRRLDAKARRGEIKRHRSRAGWPE